MATETLILRPNSTIETGGTLVVYPSGSDVTKIHLLVNEEVYDVMATQVNFSTIGSYATLGFDFPGIPDGAVIKSLSYTFVGYSSAANYTPYMLLTLYTGDANGNLTNVDEVKYDFTHLKEGINSEPVSLTVESNVNLDTLREFGGNTLALRIENAFELVANPSGKKTCNMYFTQVYMSIAYEMGDAIYLKKSGIWTPITGAIYRKENGTWVERDSSVLNEGPFSLVELTE